MTPYVARASVHERGRDAEARLSARISRLRLATFLPAAAVVVWMLAYGATPWLGLAALILFASFAALVYWHARVEDRVAWYDAIREVNLRADARVARDWRRLPPGDAPGEIELSQHPYALDLDIFGRASLFQWLGPAATAGGRRTLALWLLRPAPTVEIVDRQEAVAVLAPLEGWREHLAAHGLLAVGARQPEIDRFLEWAEGAAVLGSHAGVLRAGVYTILGSFWGLAALHAAGVVATALWLIPLLAGIILSFAFAARVQSAFDRAGGGQDALARYAALFEHAVTAPATTSRLKGIRDKLSAEGAPAPRCMRRLNRILGFAALRRGAAILHFPIQAVTLWDFHVLFALERWRRGTGTHVRDWLQALSELDVLALLGAARHDNPQWCFPAVAPSALIDATALGHPLIPDDRRVANDVSVGPPGTVLLVTGSNMSGKSTLLRSIGLNVVLAQAGGVCCAARLSLPESDLQTSIRVQDSLELGLSYFMAALARLKGVVDAAQHERPGRVLVYLLDEILQGTNSAERAIAVRAVARHLLEAGAIGAMTTHDLTLAAEEPLDSAARLVHFTEVVDDNGAMRFDYRLRPGLATSRNALRLMQMIGIEL